MTEVIVRSVKGLMHTVEARGHQLAADEPTDAGGEDAGPTPYELLLGALGACTAMTVGLYARRKSWPLESVEVHLSHERVHARDCEDCEAPNGAGYLDRITKRLSLHGPLDADQRARLLEISERCPVQRTLERPILVITQPDEAPGD
jgi:putative redox protein